MIAHLEGRVIHKSPEFAIIDVNGVGYQVFIPLSTFYELPDQPKSVRLHTYTHVREDALQLYGFNTIAEKTMFTFLLGISGIGPKLALNILSGIGIPDLEQAIMLEDVIRIKRVPGVGKKTAERIIIELRDKIGKKTCEAALSAAKKDNLAEIYEDAISALVNLGYKRPSAESALRVIEDKGNLSLEAILKKALRGISQL